MRLFNRQVTSQVAGCAPQGREGGFDSRGGNSWREIHPCFSPPGSDSGINQLSREGKNEKLWLFLTAREGSYKKHYVHCVCV